LDGNYNSISLKLYLKLFLLYKNF